MSELEKLLEWGWRHEDASLEQQTALTAEKVYELGQKVDDLTAEIRQYREAVADAYEPGCDCATCELFRASEGQDAVGSDPNSYNPASRGLGDRDVTGHSAATKQCPRTGTDGHNHPANPCPVCEGTGSAESEQK